MEQASTRAPQGIDGGWRGNTFPVGSSSIANDGGCGC